MMLISVILGLMFGVALFVLVTAIMKPNLSLIAVLLPMFIVAIPMVSTLVRLRKAVRRA